MGVFHIKTSTFCSFPSSTHSHLIMQNAFSLASKASIIFNSLNIIQKSKVSFDTQGNFLARSTYKKNKNNRISLIYKGSE